MVSGFYGVRISWLVKQPGPIYVKFQNPFGTCACTCACIVSNLSKHVLAKKMLLEYWSTRVLEYSQRVVDQSLKRKRNPTQTHEVTKLIMPVD